MTSRLRIALVADGDPSLPSTNSGVARGLLAALRSRDDVEVVAAIDSTPSRLARLVNAAWSFRLQRTRWTNQFRKGRLSTWLRSRARDDQIRRLGVSADVLIHVRNTYLPSALPYASFIDGTASLSQRNWPEWAMSPRAASLREQQERVQFTKAVAVLTAGRHAAEEVVTHYGQDPDKVFVVGGGTNFAVDVHEDAASRDDGIVRFLFVGADFERKGGHVLLEAFDAIAAEYPQARLAIVGPRARPAQLPPGVEWHGYVGDRDEVRRLYESADVFCLPSLYEPYGLAIQEALAHGLPCIVSDRGALAEIIGYGAAGLVVPAESSGDLAAAMRTLIQSPAMREAMGAEGRRLLGTMSWENVAERVVAGLRARLSAQSPMD